MRMFRPGIFAAAVCAVLLVSALSGHSADRIVPVGNGAYTVGVPDGWRVNPNAPFGATMLVSENPGDEWALTCPLPNPALTAGQIIVLELTSLEKQGIKPRITASANATVDGRRAALVQFVAPLDDSEALLGVMQAITVDGHAIVMIATAPDKQFDAFMKNNAERVFASVKVRNFASDAAALERFRRSGLELREAYLADILGDEAGDPKARDAVEKYIEGLDDVFSIPELDVKKAG